MAFHSLCLFTCHKMLADIIAASVAQPSTPGDAVQRRCRCSGRHHRRHRQSPQHLLHRPPPPPPPPQRPATDPTAAAGRSTRRYADRSGRGTRTMPLAAARRRHRTSSSRFTSPRVTTRHSAKERGEQARMHRPRQPERRWRQRPATGGSPSARRTPAPVIGVTGRQGEGVSTTGHQ